MAINANTATDKTPISGSELLALVMPLFLAIIFVTSFVFQLTVIPETIEIKGVSRVVNASLLAMALAGAVVLWLARLERFTVEAGLLYVLPLMLILVGYMANLAVSISNASIGYMSILIPPAVALVIPFLKHNRTRYLWNVYYWLLLLLCIISVVEYVLVFSGVLPTHPLPGREGYLLGFLTMFFDYGATLPHYRMYGTFFEPGTGALLAVPAMTYALMTRRFIGATVLLSLFILGNSLGGYAALGMVLLAIVYTRLDWRAFGAVSHAIFWLLLTSVVACATILFFLPQYNEKSFSATVREQNILRFFWDFPSLVLAYPTGLSLVGDSLTSLGGSAGYLGSNFMPYVAFVQGGIISLVGYMLLFVGGVIMSIRVLRRPTLYSRTALWAALSMPALLVFSFQRASVFETVLLGFLYGAPIIEVLRKQPRLESLRAVGAGI